jgi:hypothetical protein
MKTITLHVNPRGHYQKLANQAARMAEEHSRMKQAIEDALFWLEPDTQPSLRVFKARNLLRDSLKRSE